MVLSVAIVAAEELGFSASERTVWIELIVVMTLLSAAVAAPRIDWLWLTESLTAPRTPMFDWRLVAIDQ